MRDESASFGLRHRDAEDVICTASALAPVDKIFMIENSH